MFNRQTLAEYFQGSDAAERGDVSLGISTTATPESRLVEAQANQSLRAAISGLTREHYAVITLIYDDGFMQSQIADALGVSPAAVSQMHRRALERLKTSLGLMGIRGPEDL